MKRMMKFGLALFFIVFVAPVWAHHAAEGIVSDEIWDRIDQQLEDADSPHLNIDFDDVMGSMRVGPYPGDESDDLYLITEVTAYVDEVDDYMAVIDAVMEDIMNPTLEDSNQVPAGNMISDRNTGAFFEVEYVLDENDELDYANILLYEPIGNGNSFEDMDSEPPQTGKRADG